MRSDTSRPKAAPVERSSLKPAVLLVAGLMGALGATAAGADRRATPATGAVGAGRLPQQSLPETVPAAWEETRRYLEQRVLEAPGDVQARLALAQQQVTRASTLRSGIVQLSQLAGDREVGAAAIDSWRDALSWTDGQPSDIPLFRAYLRVRPQDAAVQARLRDLQRRGSPPVAAAPPPPAARGGQALSASALPALEPLPASAPAAPAAPVYSATAPFLASPPPVVRGAVLPPAPAPSADAAPAAAGPLPMPPMPAVVLPYPTAAYPAYAETQAARSVPPAAPAATGWNAPLAAPGAAALDKAQGLQQEIADLERDRVTILSSGVVVRSRQGENGLSKFTDTELPLQLRFDLGNGKATIFITPTVLTTGSPSTDPSVIGRFGGGPSLAAALPGASAGSQNASGVGLGVGYEKDNLAVDVGTTPIGFQYVDLNGGVRYRLPVSEDFSFSLNMSRRAVNDSVLSFAGQRDARSGVGWGGVSATGGRLDANYDSGGFGVYSYGALHRLTGHQVESNTRAELGAGVYWRMFRTADSALTAGLAASGLSFDKNLSYFTYGHGGYFSPQQFVTLAVPVEWQKRSGRLSYQIKGSVGVQNVRTDGAPLFPLDGVLQAAAGNPYYTGSSRTGPGYNLGAALEYQLEPRWFLGSRFALDNARDYRQFSGSVYVRHAFGPYQGPQALPVNPLRSPYGG